MDITLERILELISLKNLSQKDVTDFLGISANSFTNWKSERNTSYKKYVYAIAEYFGVSVDYLLGKTDEKNKPTTDSDRLNDDDIKVALFDGDKEVPDEAWDEIKDYIKHYIKGKYNL